MILEEKMSNKIRKFTPIIFVILIIITVQFMLPKTADAAGVSLSISPKSGKAGTKIAAKVQLPDQFMDVYVFLDINNNGTWDKDEPGQSTSTWFSKSWTTSFNVPKSLKPGIYTVRVNCENSRMVLVWHYTSSTTFTVVKE
jgi:hypothetical protein